MKFVPHTERLGSIPLVTDEVVDVTDAERWPNIAEAIDWARKQRTAND